MSFSEWSNNKKKKNTDSFSDWSNSKYGVTEDDDDIAPLPGSSANEESTNWLDLLKQAKNKVIGVKDSVKEDSYKKENDERTWFQKGAFEDGYQFGDLTKTLEASMQDIRSDVLQGILGIGESTIDAGATLVGGAGKLFGADSFAEKTKGFVAKDIINEEEIARMIVGGTNSSANTILGINDFEESSVFGDKSDSLVQSGGQLVGQIGLQTVGVPWYVTSGITSFGSATEEAFRNDATYGQAIGSGIISAGAEILSEKLFGGSGLGEKGLINVQALTNGISNKVVKTLLDFGIDVFGEGAEEAISEFFGNLGSALYREENLKDILFSEEALDSYLEAAIGGAVLGGTMNSLKVGSSIKNKTDYHTGLSANEEKVFNAVLKERLAEKGENLSKRETKKLYDDVLEEIKTGRIGTDTIERVLGGETYEGYKNLAEQETSLTDKKKAIEDEISSLVKTPEPQFTVEQRERLNSLREEAKSIEEQLGGIDTKTSKQNLFNEVNKLTENDTFLRESYKQREKRGQAFTADLKKYKGKQREAVKRAIDSGVLNDTYRSHELVETLSRLEAEKGIVFDYTNNKKLAQSGMALQGKTINGFEKDGVVTLNVQSSKAWQSTVGHEITHVLEGTEAYGALQQALVEYAKSKGDYQGRYDALVELYKGVKGYETDFEAKIQKELTADLVGDYLFSDKAFVDRLVGNRTLFQKVWDEVKYLCKVATGKELTEIEKVNREFERAWKQVSVKNETTATNDSKTDNVKLSMIGENSKTADKQKLANAEIMLEQGEDSETIRKETGWVKSYDGKWRYEIDDSKAEWKIDSAKPDEHRLFYFGEKVYKLSDLLDHKELFEAYPQLKDVAVYSSPYIEHGNGSVVGRNTDSMSIGDVQNDTTTKWAIIHELQHIIQNIEGFARGSSKSEFTQKEWGDKEYDAFEKRNEVARKLYNVLRRNGVSISNEAIYEEQNYGYGYKVSDEIIESNYWTLSNLADRNPRTRALVDEYYEQVRILNATTPEGQYHNTAGEIEAYDTMARMRMSADERKAKRPNIDNPNAIVLGIEDNATSATWLSKNEVDYDPETATLKEQIIKAQDALNQRKVVASADYGKRQFKNKAEAKKWVQKTLAQWGGQVDRQNFGTIFFSKTDLDYAIEHINDPYQQTALGLLPYVLKRGDIIGEHNSHKMRGKHTITIGAPVEINGARGNMGVVVNMNGKHAYSARVLLPDGSAFVFSEDIEKTSQGMHQGVLENESLADTTSEVSDNSIAPLSENVNTQFSLSQSVEETDANYMSAVERGDTETAQKMVDEAADLAMPDSKIRGKDGKLVPLYHGTKEMFYEFDTSVKGGANGVAEGFGIYLSDDTEVTGAYGDRQIKLYANITKPATSFDKTITSRTLAKLIKDTCEKEAQKMVADGEYDSVKDAIRDTWISNYVYTYEMSMDQAYREVATSFLKQNSSDMDIIQEVMFGMAIRDYATATDFYRNHLIPITGFDGFVTKWENSNTGKTSNIYLAFDSSQLKSADTITKDDKGNVIPLSDRFNTSKKDFRHSLSNDGEEFAPTGNYSTPLRETALEQDIAPVADVVAENATATVGDTTATNTGDDAPAEQTVDEKISAKKKNLQTELDNNIRLRGEASADFDAEIARLRSEYEAKKNKNTKAANDILRRIERIQRLKNNVDADYEKRITTLRERIQKIQTPQYKRGEQRRAKQAKWASEIREMIGDTSTWKDRWLGISYRTNTLRRNLRTVVRGADGKPDIAKADRIYEYLQGSYNHNEAQLKRESVDIKKPFADMKINKYESAYIQMLGEFKYNPDTKLTLETVDEYYGKHKDHIDLDKVNQAIDKSRKIYDDLFRRVNAVLREVGLKEMGYREGYFPHFTDPKQSWLAKLFNWKTIDNDIPTDIAGLTEEFNPVRSYQSYDKHRKGDTTDYDFLKGFDTYVHGALDWIYHIEDIQKRRAFETEIRYRHSEQGIRDKVDEIRKMEDLDADEVQQKIDEVYRDAKNPLNNFVTDLRNGTNALAGKKSTEDRQMEYDTRRSVYSTMTNISNRVSANMVVGSISSALTNFIPITQSWSQVSPVSSLVALGDTIRNAYRDDGMIRKSDFMTNRLIEEEQLSQTGWDKASRVAGSLMNIFDHISTEVVWRSKFKENMSKGMSESEAIHDADIFAENIMAGRSRGNMPTIYNSKNPITKMFTAFQLEVGNQYGYMFQDMPQDIGKENIGKLTAGYAKMFIGAYVYNALFSKLTGRDAAFDPIGIIEDLLRDLGFGDDDEEEEMDISGALDGLAYNIMQEVPYVGGVLGGGRVPISSALPYDGIVEAVTETKKDLEEGDWANLTKEWLNVFYYGVMPFGGGQLKKINEGLGMFSDDHPVSGSYTVSGNLRFPVEDTPLNRLQAALFGQYASENAREYFDNDYAPLKEKQIQEYMDVDIPIKDYWEYREGLSKQETLEDKFDYIAGLDLPVEKKNILINNIVDRKDKVDLENYDDFASLEEFDFATKYPDKYAVSKVVGGYSSYKTYTSDLYDIKADKDANGKTITGSRKEKVLQYINGLNADYETKIILYKSEYPSDDTYNAEIINYVNNRADLTYEERVSILTGLGFRVVNGNIYAD